MADTRVRPRPVFGHPGKLVLAAVAVLVVIGLGFGIWRLGSIADISFTGRNPAARLMEQLLDAANLPTIDRGEMETIAADGPQPDIASLRLRTGDNATDVARKLAAACRSMGLASTTPSDRELFPDAICAGMWGGGQVNVQSKTVCTDGCLVDLETHYGGWSSRQQEQQR